MEEALKLSEPVLLSSFITALLLTLLFSWFYHSLRAFSRIRLSGVVGQLNLREELVKRTEDVSFIAINSASLFLVLSISLLFYSFRLPVMMEIVLAIVIFVLFYIAFPWMLASKASSAGLRVLSFMLPALMRLGFPFLAFKGAFSFEPGEVSEKSFKEEVEAYIDEGKEEKLIEEGEEELLRNVIDFSETKVKEIMTPRSRIFALPADMTVEEAAKSIAKYKRSRVPVYREVIDAVEGILYAKDLLAYFSSRNKNKVTISKLLRKALALPETTPISKALKQMQEKRTKIALVVDEFGGVSGLVTLEDIVEELIGEIREQDERETVSIEEGKGFLRVKGDAEIEEVEEMLQVDFPEGDYSTVSGLIMHHLGRIPDKGETFEINGIKFVIEDADERRIKKVKILKVRPSEPSG